MKILGITVMMVLAIGIVVVPNAEAAKINVLLTKVWGNIGIFDVSVTIKGVQKSKQVSTDSQYCPDDVDRFCYTKAGSFNFYKVKKGTSIEVCAAATTNTDIQCAYFKANGKDKQTVRVMTPQLPIEQQTAYDPANFQDYSN